MTVRDALLFGFLFGVVLVFTTLMGDSAQEQNAFSFIRLISFLNLASGITLIATRRGFTGQLGGLLTGSGIGINATQLILTGSL